MTKRDMRFLHPRSLATRHNQRHITKRRGATTITAEKPDRPDAHTARHLKSLDHIRGPSRSGNAKQNVALPAKPRKGAREDILEPIIIAARGQRRWIKRQRDGGPRWAFNTRSEAHQ